MAIHSVSNSSSTSSSPVLSSTSNTTPTASYCSPISSSSSSQASASIPMAASALNILGNGHFATSQDYSSSSSVSGINILSSSLNSTNKTSSHYANSSDHFGSSINNGNSIHIGNLTSGLSGLSLAAQNYHPGTPTSSSLSSGLFSYNGHINGANITNGSSLFSTNNNTPSSNNNNSSSNNNNGNNNNNNSNGSISSNNSGSGISNNGQQEEISTIFVVGFPDDMQEREFQNMFVFTPGFEAATLKIPNKDQQEDDALTLGVNGVNPRKQIIGFAKFRTHQEALQAITVLSGRRVDAEKGSLLKAEMAKKNLHTRRGLSNELVAATATTAIATVAPNQAVVLPPTPIGINSSITNARLPPHLQHRNSLAGSAAYDAFHSVPCSPALPIDLLPSNDYPSSYDPYTDMYTLGNVSNLSFTESFGGRRQSLAQQQQQPELSSSFLGRQSAFDMNRIDPLSVGSLSNNAGGFPGSVAGSFPNSVSNSFSNRHIGLGGSQRFNKSFLDLDADAPTTTSGYLSKSIPAHTERGFNSVFFNSEEMTNPRFQGLPINTTAATALAPSILSPGIASPGFRPSVNPGDQNPPCNTLYVGNLPMNTSEDELRALFSRCVGYRRMCFRTKLNTGPMCFVEFESIDCATQALNDLYGNPLSNSVKGGIRLSYSKNPLGVRSSTTSQSNGLGTQLASGTSFLDRRDSMSAMFDQHY